METDCVVPSPSSLSQQPHLSNPSGIMLLEARVSGRERQITGYAEKENRVSCIDIVYSKVMVCNLC